jgi:ribosome-binding protein aMBF1 (putative translation factor)
MEGFAIMTTLDELHLKWLKRPKYKKAYDNLEEEYAIIGAMLDARSRAGMTQAQLARKLKTTQSAIARLEGGKGNPSLQTLSRFAAATGTKLKITFEPVSKRTRA